MDVTLYPNEDWTVDSTVGVDSCALTFLGPDGSEVRFEASYAVLSELGERWVKEYGGAANGRNPDAILDLARATAAYKRASEKIRTNAPEATSTLDKIDEKIDNLEKLLTERNKDDDSRYPADFRPGDWVRFPPQRAWRRIDAVHELPGGNFDVIYTFGGVPYPQQVRAATRYPYCPAARFAEVCDR